MIEIRYTEAPHAALIERYSLASSSYEAPPGDQNEFGRYIDPETGAEYTVILGRDNSHSTDFKVGPAYPPTGFVMQQPNTSHASLREFLEDHGLWDSSLHRVTFPSGGQEWVHGFQYRPPERKPYSPQAYADGCETVGLETEMIEQTVYAWEAEGDSSKE